MKCIKTHLSPAGYEVVENDPLSLLFTTNSQCSTPAAKQQRNCSHLPFHDRLAVEKPCACAMAHITKEWTDGNN